MRDRLVTVGVVTAVAAVWAIGLGIVDRVGPRTERVSYEASLTARLERRPVLFAIVRNPGHSSADGESGTFPAQALPIAIVEPNGELRPPLPAADGTEAWAAAERSFVDTYFRPGALIRILQGGANAGSMRVVGVTDREGPMPIGRGPCEGLDFSLFAPTVGAETILLGVSDPRLGAQTTGIEPMRASDRVIAIQLVRRAIAEKNPEAHIEAVDAVRVRSVDLNRDGRHEIIASALVRIRTSPQHHTEVNCCLVAEPRDESDTPYRTGLAYSGAGSGLAENVCQYTYVDQVNLSNSRYDEVVLGCVKDGRHFLVLRRGDDGWHEVYRSPVVERR
jgi:hypothetical protein